MIASLETFAKVRALNDRATSVGEREAAAGRMAQLARKVGMTVSEAISMVDALPPSVKGREQLNASAFDYYFGRGSPR